MGGGLGGDGVELPQVVEDPERAAVGGEDQLVVLDHQVMDGDGRQVEAQRVPGGAVVGREGDAVLGAQEEPAALRGVLAHGVQEEVRRQLAVEALPGASEVAGLPQVGAQVVEAVGVDDDVGGAGVEMGRFDADDRAPLRQAVHAAGDVGPGLAAVAGDVHQAVVRARPDETFLDRRLGHREDRAVDLHAGVVAGDRAAGPGLFRLVVARQVRADRRPGLAAVGTAEEHVGGVIDHLGVVGRDGDRGGPLEAVFQVFAAVPGRVLGVDPDHPRLPGAVVVARNVAAVLAGVDHVGIGRIGDHVAGLAAAHAVPVGVGDAAAGQAVARALGGADVLQRAGDAERHPGVGPDVVGLAEGQRRGGPAGAAVGADVDAAVVARDDALRVLGVDPDVVVVAVVHADVLEGLAALPPSMLCSIVTCGHHRSSGLFGATVTIE